MAFVGSGRVRQAPGTPAAPVIGVLSAEARRLKGPIDRARRIVAFTAGRHQHRIGHSRLPWPRRALDEVQAIGFDEFVASGEARRGVLAPPFRHARSHGEGPAQPRSPRRGRFGGAGQAGGRRDENIDGLHQRGGAPPGRVIELHGNATYARCLDCGERHEIAPIRAAFLEREEPPLCRTCGGIVKSATISFGQAMPQDAMARAEAATLACDLFMAMGSSLTVYPAAAFPLLAKRNGATLAILNRVATGPRRLRRPRRPRRDRPPAGRGDRRSTDGPRSESAQGGRLRPERAWVHGGRETRYSPAFHSNSIFRPFRCVREEAPCAGACRRRYRERCPARPRTRGRRSRRVAMRRRTVPTPGGDQGVGRPLVGLRLDPGVVHAGPIDKNAFLAVQHDVRRFMEELNQRWSSDLCRAVNWMTAFLGESHRAAPLSAVFGSGGTSAQRDPRPVAQPRGPAARPRRWVRASGRGYPGSRA